MNTNQNVKLFTIMKKTSFLLVIGIAFFFFAPPAKALVGQISVTQTHTEVLAADLSGATVEYICSGTYQALTGTTAADGTIAAQATTTASGCDTNAEDMSYRVSKNGYVTLQSATTTYSEITQNDLSISGVQYAYKVTGATNDVSGALSSATVKAGDSFGTTCSESSGTWYCAVPLAETELVIQLAKDGYVTNEATSFDTDRTAATDAQGTHAVADVKAALKITVTKAADGSALTSAVVKAGDSYGTNCTESGSTGVYYCPIPLANTGTTARASKDNYALNTATYTDRTAATDAQGTITIALAPQQSTGGNFICTENWACGTWPTSCTNNNQARNCTDNNHCGTTSNRPSQTRTCTMANNEEGENETDNVNEKIKVCHVAGNGNTNTLEIAQDALAAHLEHGDKVGECALAYYSPADITALLNSLKKYRNTEEEDKAKQKVLSDSKEFNVSLTTDGLDQAAIFVSYGIDDNTNALGSGERQAVLRDYLQTTGFAEIKWDDIARMTAGVKPVNRNLAKEQQQVAQALQTFEAVYGHRPNFQNSAEDLAWNTLMYRIRFTRNLEAEKTGITEFKKIFSQTPTTPFQWSVVRVLGYIE